MSVETALHPGETSYFPTTKHPHSQQLLGPPKTDMATASSDAATATGTMKALGNYTGRSLSASPTNASPFFNPSSSTSSLNAKLETSSSASGLLESSETAATIVDIEPDAQILEALKSKDRLYVLKLGEQMEALIKERRMRLDLTPSTSYQRLLVHRCSAYYKLSPESDPTTKAIIVYCRSESRIPARRICELVPAEESAQPAFQIMRRGDRQLRGRQYSQPGSTAGEDADTSDVDASEAGSIGGISSAASSGARRYKTIEEREAEYNQARSRIFHGFEEKKDKDMSANSSTFSLVSGSGSTSGGRGSSIGDMDDSASSAPTESEWSGPVTRDKRDARRGPGSTTSSVRSFRSTGPSYNANGSGSSRNSRATSPSFTYPTLYEPPAAPQYDPAQYPPQPQAPPGYVGQYGYPPYNPQPPGQPYANPYYYQPQPQPPPYPYPLQPPHSDSVTPGETMYPPPPPPPNAPHQQPYAPSYMWTGSPAPTQPPLPPPLLPRQHPPQPGMPPGHPESHMPAHPMPPMQNVRQYSYPAPSTPYGYGMPGYHYQQPYQPGAPMGPPPPPMPGQGYPQGPMPEYAGPNSNGNGIEGPSISRTSSRNSNGHGSISGKRGPPRARSAWTYGPGVSTGGFTYTPNGASNGGDAFGPRLSTNTRRTSGNSSGGSAGARTPADETSSTASSSTTSSSSRRTFTSTSTTSKHPLPARPDWAVGLKPQHPRHLDHHNNASRNMSPARMAPPHLSQQSQSQPVLQSNDFPPLSAAQQTRQPVVGGAWTNASSSRVMVASPPGPGTAQGTALVHYPHSQQSSPQVPTAPAPAALGRLDEQDTTFERPPPKNAELFNPKAGTRNSPNAGSTSGKAQENGRGRANTGANGSDLADKMGAMALADSLGGVGEGLLIAMPAIGTSTGDTGVYMDPAAAAAASS